MGLVKCPDCGNMVSERASACPSCGCPADAFGSASTESLNSVGTVQTLELKPVSVEVSTGKTSIIDDKFRRSDGTLDDTHNVFSPNYKKSDVSIIGDEFRKSDGTLDDTHNVFSPNYKKPENPDCNAQIASFIAYAMYRSCDRRDLMLANNIVLDYLKNNLSTGRPITFFSIEQSDIVEKTVNKFEFSFPYVMVTTSFRYFTDYRKFTLTKSDGRSYSRYYDQKTLPSQYAPRIEVISDVEAEVIEITEKIKELFNEPKYFSVPFLGVKEETFSFPCELETVLNERDIYNGGKTIFLQKTVVFKFAQWASFIDDEVNPTPNDSMRFFRKLQYAQFCLLYSGMKDTCDSQLTLYEWLYLYVSKMRGVFGPAQTNEYKILKNRIQTGQPFDADLVDKAFPNISLIYHELPNDIGNRVSVDEIRKNVYRILDQYKINWEKTCAEINLPNDFVFYGKTLSVRDNDGMLYVLGALEKNMMRSFDDVFEEMKAKVVEMYMEEQREAQGSYYEPEPSQSYGGGSSFLGDVLKTATGVALGNKISGNSNNGRKDFMGSAGCQIGKKDDHGFTETCNWTCPLWHNCSRGG